MSKLSIPEIFTANTYFWKPGTAASQRRRSEANRQAEAVDFFAALSMEVSRDGDDVTGVGHGLTCVFSYSETCKNVYKRLAIVRDNGQVANIVALRKLVDRLNGIEAPTTNAARAEDHYNK